MNFISKIISFFGLIGGLFLAKKTYDLSNEVETKQTQIDNLKIDNEKKDIEVENSKIEKEQLKNEVKVEKVEEKIDSLKKIDKGIKHYEEKNNEKIKSFKKKYNYKNNYKKETITDEQVEKINKTIEEVDSKKDGEEYEINL